MSDGGRQREREQLRDLLADDALVDFIANLRDSDASVELTVEQQRLQQAERVKARPRGPEVGSVVNIDVPAHEPLPVRLYLPPEPAHALLVYLHGGGWSIGSLDSHDAFCRHLCVNARIAVAAVDYRLAPENPWPASVNDAMVALAWAMHHSTTLAGTSVVGVGGDSAGAHLAAVACLLRRDMGAPQPAFQLLLYPNLDLTLSRPSITELGADWIPTPDGVKASIDQWIPPDVDRAHPRVSPLFEPDLSGLAPAIVVTCEFDPLRDEGDQYAHRMTAAGVPVIHRQEPGLIHGFLTFGAHSPACQDARDRVAADIVTLVG